MKGFFSMLTDNNEEKILLALPVKIIHLLQITVVFNILVFWHFLVLSGKLCLFFNLHYKMFL